MTNETLEERVARLERYTKFLDEYITQIKDKTNKSELDIITLQSAVSDKEFI